MFLEFYQMREQPFGVTPDQRFLYLGKSHREALASLFYGIESDRGFVALIAEPGLGKTTLTFQLLEKLQKAARTVFLFQTQCNSRELIHYLLDGLGVDGTGMDIVSMNNKLNVILSREMLAGRRFVLAIDEAQNLEPDVLETVRLLSNFETSRAKLLQIVLIGQPQLARKLAGPSLVQLRQRISVFARLEPFGSEETARYIAHRLGVAGYGGGPLFTPGALQIIADRSRGVPRNINSLCFSSLSLARAMGRKRVDSEIMREVVTDRDLDCSNKPIVVPPCVSAPAAASSVLSYRRPSSKNRFSGWALGAACVAASIAAATVILPSCSSGIGRFFQTTTEASASVPNSRARSDVSGTESASGLIPSLAKAPIEIDGIASPQSPSSSKDDTNIVVVRSGDTLRQIALRTMGRYSDKIREEIRQLNPAIIDPNHVEIGQKVRVPQFPLPLASPPASEAANTTGKN
jgi:general secretion pathway protein A